MKITKAFALCLILSAVSAFAGIDAIKPQFADTIVEPYLAIQKGLAADDLKAAKTGAKQYLEAMEAVPHEAAEHKEAANLSAPARAIATAPDIKSARSAFLSLSQEVIPLVEQVGTIKDTPIYLAYCPMAFNNKGGSWFQVGKTIANPYYGSMMLRCGVIKKLIAGSEKDSE